MKIYVTGGSGFLGQHLLPRLADRGHDVAAPRSAEVNLMSVDAVKAFLQDFRPDTVIHSAAYYGGIGITEAEPVNLFYRNIVMTANLFEAVARSGVKQLLPVGSACAYPGHLTGDLKESDFWSGRCHASVEAYGFSKRVQFVGQTALHKEFGVSSVHLILTNLYGEHDEFGEYRSHVAAALIKKFCDAHAEGRPEVTCWGDGSPIREFLYAGDAAETIARMVGAEHDPDPVNVGTGTGTSIRELAEMIVDIVGYEGQVIWDTSKPAGVGRKVLDVSRMKRKLGWQPPTKLREGLERTIAWYQQQGAGDMGS